MNEAVPDCLVHGYEPLIAGLDLPDKTDLHILAAAIHCNADAIVTFNLKDFPAGSLSPYNIEAQHPDEFLCHQIGLNLAAVIIAAKSCRAQLKQPPKSAEDFLSALEKCQLPETVDALLEYSTVI